MKLWKFYKKPEKDAVKKEYELYAFTNNKEYAERFKNERDFNKQFLSVKSVEVEREEYVMFANDNRGQLLELAKFETKRIDDDNKYRIYHVELLVTENEKQMCSGEELEDGIFDVYSIETLPTYKIFNKKLIKSLRKIEFVKYYKLMANNPIMDDEDDDYTAPDFQVDELACFVKLFQYLFK